MTDKIEFESVLREHVSNKQLHVLAHIDSGQWIAVHAGTQQLGARYRVAIERVRAPLPEGFVWDGNEICYCTIRWYVDSGAQGPTVYTQGGAWTPLAVIEAFQAEGLL